MNNSNKREPCVSIVMPSYNRAHLLPEVINSIIDQDFGDFELLVIDDGSVDNTLKVLERISNLDERVRCIAIGENRGLGFAREFGRKRSSGKYVALTDSDDLWMPGRLKEQVRILERYESINILFGDFLDVHEDSGFRELKLPTSPGLKYVISRSLEEDLFLAESGMEEGILRSNFIGTPTVLMRREVFERVGGFKDLPGCDLEFFWRAAAYGEEFAYINYPLIERRILGDSMIKQGVKPLHQRLEGLQTMYATCKRSNRRDLMPYVRAATERSFSNLLRRYGEMGLRTRAFLAYICSLRYKVSAKNFIWFAAAMIGPKFISGALSARERSR